MLRLACLVTLLVTTDALAQTAACGAPTAVNAAMARRQFESLASRSARTRGRALSDLGPARTLRVGGPVEIRYDAAQQRLWFGTEGTASPADVAVPARLRAAGAPGVPEPAESHFGVPLPGDSLALGPVPSIRLGRLRARMLDLERNATACVFHVYSVQGDARPMVRLDRLELAVAGYGDPVVWSWTFPAARSDG